MRRIDNDAIRAAGEIRFRSEYDYAVFEYVRSRQGHPVGRALRGEASSGRVLDAGCGSGGTALSIAEEVDFAVGLDLSPRFSDAGTRLAREKRIAQRRLHPGRRPEAALRRRRRSTWCSPTR
jgi:SAM-dependent methyltransferase